MWIDLFLSLLLAHLVADFVLQTNASCAQKKEKHWRSPHQYFHGLIVFGLSWLVSGELCFWWCALLIGAIHCATDVWKSYQKETVGWFTLDQAFHILALVAVSLLWCRTYGWSIPWGIPARYVAIVDAALICWRPANVLMQRYEALGLLIAAKSIIRFVVLIQAFDA